MAIPRLLILKQTLINPQFNLNLTRTLSSTAVNSPFVSEILKSVANSPRDSVVPLLERHLENDDGGVLQEQLPKVVRKLRKLKRFNRALEVSEWTDRKSLNRTDAGDVAVHLDLIGKMNGIEAAEKFFTEANEHSEKVYGSMLNCYVQKKLVDKSLAHFKKMKEMGIVKNSLTYNSIISLYLKTRKPDKVLELLLEMQENGVSPDDVTYRMCLKACAESNDFVSVDKLLKDMENLANENHFKMDWFTYSTVANYYIVGGQPEKAINCLQKAEAVLHENAVGFDNLISTYAKLGELTEVTRLWGKLKDVCKTHTNADYMVMLSALIKLNEVQRAEQLLEEWESSDNEYDYHVPDVLLMRYAQNEQVEKAERLLEARISQNKAVGASSWGIISEGFVNRLNMQKAVQCMEKAIRLGPQHKEWAPKRAVLASILSWLGDHGDAEQVYDFLKLLNRVVPMNHVMYQALLKSSQRGGKDIAEVLKRLESDYFVVDKETAKIMELRK